MSRAARLAFPFSTRFPSGEMPSSTLSSLHPYICILCQAPPQCAVYTQCVYSSRPKAQAHFRLGKLLGNNDTGSSYKPRLRFFFRFADMRNFFSFPLIIRAYIMYRIYYHPSRNERFTELKSPHNDCLFTRLLRVYVCLSVCVCVYVQRQLYRKSFL